MFEGGMTSALGFCLWGRVCPTPCVRGETPSGGHRSMKEFRLSLSATLWELWDLGNSLKVIDGKVKLGSDQAGYVCTGLAEEA